LSKPRPRVQRATGPRLLCDCQRPALDSNLRPCGRWSSALTTRLSRHPNPSNTFQDDCINFVCDACMQAYPGAIGKHVHMEIMPLTTTPGGGIKIIHITTHNFFPTNQYFQVTRFGQDPKSEELGSVGAALCRCFSSRTQQQ